MLTHRTAPYTSHVTAHDPALISKLYCLSIGIMETMLQDIRYAFRTLRKAPAFAIAAVLTLALGIGANSAIFSVVNGVLLKPLPYPESDRLVTVWGQYPEFGRTSTSLPDFRDWREGARSFENFAGRHGTVFNLTAGGEPVQLAADRVTSNFFQTLRVQPAIGRGFLPEEELGNDNFVAVLSHGFWMRQFGGDSTVVGRTIQLSGTPYTVVGIAPENFWFWRDVDLWVPARTDDQAASRRSEYLVIVGRLRPGVTIDRAGEEIAGVAARLAEEYPETNASLRTEVLSLHDQMVGDVRSALLVFTAAVGLVLLIACANVANLLLARAAVREREMAIRSALGAARRRLVRQLLTETMVVAALGCALGLLLALWAVDAFQAAGGGLLPRLAEVQVDSTVILFSVALALATGLLFGMVPAMRLASGALHDSLREGARGAGGRGVTRFRSALVLGEVALAVVLLVSAGLLIRSFDQLNRVDPGFNPANVLNYRVILPVARYGEVSQLNAVYSAIIERTKAIPGVQGAAVSGSLPLEGAGYATFAVEGRQTPDMREGPEDVQPFSVSAGYFSVMQIPLRSGRVIEPADVDGAPGVAVVNEEFVRRFIPDREPLGLRVTYGNPDNPESTWYTIVGVVANVAQEGVNATPYPQMYRSIAQVRSRGIWVSMRTASDPLLAAPAARQALRAVDPELPLSLLNSMEERIARDIAAPRVSVGVIGIFAAVALILAAIGIYGVLSYSVTQRTREIGIRMALGASAGDVRRLVVRQGMTPALIGLAAGILGSLFATSLMSSLLFGVAPTDPVTYFVVTIFLIAVAFVASYLPARRATRVTPTEALRYE